MVAGAVSVGVEVLVVFGAVVVGCVVVLVVVGAVVVGFVVVLVVVGAVVVGFVVALVVVGAVVVGCVVVLVVVGAVVVGCVVVVVLAPPPQDVITSVAIRIAVNMKYELVFKSVAPLLHEKYYVILLKHIFTDNTINSILL